jgi:hypothetical protein
MEYIVTCGVIILAVILALATNIDRGILDTNTYSTESSEPINIVASTKKCLCCLKEIKADAIKCGNCGSLINFF